MKSKKKPAKKKVSKKSPSPFKVGALVTGVDRSYQRSIYKFLSAKDKEWGLFEFQSLGADCVLRWKDQGASVLQYQLLRRYEEFRLATRKEIKKSEGTKVTYRLRKLLRLLGIYPSSRSDDLL